jgi:hypothetical protein
MVQVVSPECNRSTLAVQWYTEYSFGYGVVVPYWVQIQCGNTVLVMGTYFRGGANPINGPQRCCNHKCPITSRKSDSSRQPASRDLTHQLEHDITYSRKMKYSEGRESVQPFCPTLLSCSLKLRGFSRVNHLLKLTRLREHIYPEFSFEFEKTLRTCVLILAVQHLP